MTLPGDIDLRLAWAVWMRNVTVYKRTWQMNLLPNFFEPVLYLVGMGLGLGAYIEDSISGLGYLEFVAPGLMAAAAMNGGSFESTYNMFIKMNFARLYDAFMSTPAEIQDIAFGELMWAVTRALIYGLAFFAILLLFTALGRPIIVSPWAVLVPFALALIGATFALIGQAFTSMIRVIDLYSYYYTLFLTPLFLFSGIFFPVTRFPYGDTIAWFTPLYHGVRLVRGLAQGPIDLSHGVSALWLLLVSIALLWFVPRRMRSRLVS